jgi:branched-chain amino acid transport system ATP-binding protein
MNDLLGTSLGLFVLVTLVMFGGAAWQTGQALAQTWRPYWHMVVYGLMLAATDRLLLVLLFGGKLMALVPFLVAAIVLVGLGSFAYRLTQARKMVGQYPWIYERNGLLGWRERSGREPS